MHFNFNTALGRGRLPMKEIDIFYWSQAIEQLVFLLGKRGREISLEHDFPAPTFQVWFRVLHSVSVHQQPQVDSHTAAPQSEKEPFWYTDSWVDHYKSCEEFIYECDYLIVPSIHLLKMSEAWSRVSWSFIWHAMPKTVSLSSLYR